MKNSKNKMRYIKNPLKIIRTLGVKGWLNGIPDEIYLKLLYWGEMGKKLNLDNPKTFNEKIQWLKLYDRKPEYVKYVDKYEVRDYIRKTIGEKYLIPLIGKYEKVEEIDWDGLPDQFVLKCNHGSGCNVICEDKSKLDIVSAKIDLNHWLKQSWYWFGREWPYKEIEPKIICEKFISDTDTTPDDYKVLCFNGKAKLIEVHIDRFNGHKVDFYDMQWNKTTISKKVCMSDKLRDQPDCLEEMIRLSEQLSENMRFSRIDWFVVKKKLYFGEITLYESSGLCPYDNEADDYMLGGWIDLKAE